MTKNNLSRKMIPIDEIHHGKIKELADHFKRSIRKQCEWLIEQAYQEYKEFENVSRD